MKCFVQSAGVLGPGLAGWQQAASVLAGAQAYEPSDLLPPKPEMLPPVERRRTGTVVKLALAAGQDALSGTGCDAAALPTVFTASGGDGEVIDEICATLATQERQVSPTRFHNSVHNAPAGYWSIATGSRAPSTSLCALDWSFAAGLVEAAAQVAGGCERLLLIAYDVPYPQPLRGVRPVSMPFACALLLTRDADAAMSQLDVRIEAGAAASRMPDPRLEALRLDNPAARGLPLLAAVAAGDEQEVILDYTGGNALRIGVSPC
jgi:hypothetical protein